MSNDTNHAQRALTTLLADRYVDRNFGKQLSALEQVLEGRSREIKFLKAEVNRAMDLINVGMSKPVVIDDAMIERLVRVLWPNQIRPGGVIGDGQKLRAKIALTAALSSSAVAPAGGDKEMREPRAELADRTPYSEGWGAFHREQKTGSYDGNPYCHGPETGSLNGGYCWEVDEWRRGYDAAKAAAAPAAQGVDDDDLPAPIPSETDIAYADGYAAGVKFGEQMIAAPAVVVDEAKALGDFTADELKDIGYALRNYIIREGNRLHTGPYRSARVESWAVRLYALAAALGQEVGRG